MNNQLPSTTALLCFEAAARHLSVSRAADELHLTQSAVSRQIKTLEAFLERRLFDRVRQRLRLSETGRKYLKDIRPLLRGLTEATQLVKGYEQHLTIAAEAALTSRWLIPRMREFRQAFPKIDIDMQTANNPLREVDGFDVAFIYGEAAVPGYRTELLFEEVLVAVSSPEVSSQGGEFAALSDITKFPVLHHLADNSSTQVWFEACGLDPADWHGQGFNRFSLMVDAAREGLGIAVVPLFFVEKELNASTLVEACQQRLATGVSYRIAVAEENLGSTSIELFRDWALAQV